jgi:hypothetical protein
VVNAPRPPELKEFEDRKARAAKDFNDAIKLAALAYVNAMPLYAGLIEAYVQTFQAFAKAAADCSEQIEAVRRSGA